jgi:alanyl-tRNA synthetase
MEWRSTDELRKLFLDFFKSKDHLIMRSSSLVPDDDPSLLFTTAGMVQFKPYFEGWRIPPHPRIATAQKCFRLTDLERVGFSERHHTFFEMLGNFSFGDYFKKEAIEYAWEFSIDVIQFPKDRIWVSVYEEDEESYKIWKNIIGIPEERIVRLGKEDNFWGPAGDTGPCGPCSELYFDRGEEYSCGEETCAPGCDCDRFIEYWNLVFNQFFLNHKGIYEPLPKTGVDTGMGLERLAFLVQNVESVYLIDTLGKIIEKAKSIYQKPYKDNFKSYYNIIADHIRAVVFVISEGISPSNEGRGYVIRRVIRRASLYANRLGATEPTLYKLVKDVIKLYGHVYPEIENEAGRVEEILKNEERIFIENLKAGLKKLEVIIDRHKKDGVIPGKEAFSMHDTYGFPYELIEELAKEYNLSVNKQEFLQELEKQKERSRKVWLQKKEDVKERLKEKLKGIPPTEFIPYAPKTMTSKILLLLDENLNEVETLTGKGYIILDSTSAYAEAGGQVGDSGSIYRSVNVFIFEDTQKIGEVYYHIGKVLLGEFRKGDRVTLELDKDRRKKISANHTATHLLHKALRKHLGEHVKQAGSYVGPDYLRFDFSHYQPLTTEEIRTIEREVNEAIFKDLPVERLELSLKEAIRKGALAFFGEKYGERVRVIDIGEGYSVEVCGGTHVRSTMEIGSFIIIKESSAGAGIRRIEAKTSYPAFEYLQSIKETIQEASKILNTTPEKLISTIKKQKETIAELRKKSEKSMHVSEKLSDIIKNFEEYKGIRILKQSLKDYNIQTLRNIADKFRELNKNGICILGSKYKNKALLLIATTKEVVKKGISAKDILNKVAEIIEGKGGGKDEFAQAGGKNYQNIDEAIEKAYSILKENLE